MDRLQLPLIAMPLAKTLIRNVMSNWAGYVVQVIVTFAMTPYVLATLGQAGYGVWTLTMGLTGYYGLLDLGISSSLAQYLTRHLAVKDTEAFNRTASTGFAALVGCATLILSCSVLVAFNMSSLFNIPPELEAQSRLVVIVTGLSVAVQFVFTAHSAVLTALQRFDLSNGIGVLSRLLFAGAGALSLAMGWGIVGLSLALAISNIADYMARWIVAKRLVPWMAVSVRAAARTHARELMHFGFWNVAVACSVRVISYTDALVIAAFMPISAVAPFAVAASMRSYFDDVFVRAGQVVFPAAASLDANGNEQGLRSLYLVSSKLMFLGAAWCGALGLFWGPPFFRLWLGEAVARPQGYPTIALLFWFLLLGSMVTAGQRIGYQVLMGTRRLRPLAALFALEAVSNIVLSVALVRPLGLMGVAVGTLVPAILCQGVLQPLLVCRLLRIDADRYYREVLARPALVLLVCSPALFLTPHLDGITGWPTLAAGVAISVLMTAPLVFFAGLTRQERNAALLIPVERAA